jgi:hypothetical protein
VEKLPSRLALRLGTSALPEDPDQSSVEALHAASADRRITEQIEHQADKLVVQHALSLNGTDRREFLTDAAGE